MDSITHLTQKLLAERARQQPTPPPTEAPPPYEEEEEEEDMDSDLPVNITINASHTIKGNNNLVPTSPSLLQDTTKFSTLLLHAINQINAANTHANSEAAQSSKMRRQLKVDLTILCGVTVIGDRNVIGNVGVRPRNTGAAAEGQVGTKRKAEEDDGEGGVAKKKVAVSEE